LATQDDPAGTPRADLDWERRYPPELHRAYRVVANHVYRQLGRFAYQAFDHINAVNFSGELPETLILWDLTEHGHALGWCRSSEEGPPIIKIHPATVSPAEWRHLRNSGPWSIPMAYVGLCYAYDVLLHECIHACVEYLRGGWRNLPNCRSYWTSHNNPAWIAELNRLAPALGYHGDPFTLKKPKRVPISGQLTKRGKPRTKTKLLQDGGAPESEHFPHNLPGRAAFYLSRKLPFAWEGNCVA
jgi:hypothetical protein